MNDRAIGLLEKYDLEVLWTRKGRGAILCGTDRGSLIFREYTGNAEKCRQQDSLLRKLQQQGKIPVEAIIPTKEGGLLVRDHDGTAYILKTCFDGRECNIYDRGECVEAVRLLARLHCCLEQIQEERAETSEREQKQEQNQENPLISGQGSKAYYEPGAEYEKRNRELRHVKKYLRRKGQKQVFEICLSQAFDYYLDLAQQAASQWQEYARLTAGQPECRQFCHGDYQYHNIVKCGGDWCVINFEKCVRDNPVRDLYLFLRKLLEKSDWSVSLGKELLQEYEKIRPLSAYSRIDLYYRLFYPEKFWKIVNFYYNSGKAWIPERNMEKLQKLMRQEEAKSFFLEQTFQNLSNCAAAVR